MNFKIEEEKVKALTEYLATRPYKEVAQGISWLAQLQPIKDEKFDKKIIDEKDVRIKKE